MLGIQFVGVIFAVFMLYLTFLHLKRKEFNYVETIFWVVLWLGLVVVAVNPNILDFLVKDILSLSRPLDFYIIAGFLFLIAVNFYTYTTARNNKRDVEKIVREIALKK